MGRPADGRANRALASASKGYKWQNLTLRAAEVPKAGSVINSFCIGGEAEIRSGLLYQKQPITMPQLHFGLGTYAQVDAARIVWPTGNAQGEFNQKAGNVVAQQRLGGSCPFLYTWDGTKMVFVTDCIWRSPLGLKINAQVTAGTTQTEDWVKVRGDQLQAKDGFYNLSITAELRETHYFDYVGLMMVDHPADTEIFIDERFTPAKPPRLEVLPTGPPRPVRQALGTAGQDVTEIVKARDGRFLDDFGRGQYQGITRDHWVEVDLSDTPPGQTALPAGLRLDSSHRHLDQCRSRPEPLRRAARRTSYRNARRRRKVERLPRRPRFPGRQGENYRSARG